jgi:hypothetical protein
MTAQVALQLIYGIWMKLDRLSMSNHPRQVMIGSFTLPSKLLRLSS